MLAEGLQVPAGLVAHDGSLFVSEQGGGRILQLVDGGETLHPPREIASGLDGPEGIAIRDDMLFIVEAGAGRVTGTGVDGSNREVLANGLELQIEAQVGMPATNLFNGIAVSAEEIFVSGDRTNVIYAISR